MQPPRPIADRTIRDTLADPANLRDFLRAAVPDVAELLDFDAVRPVPRETFTDDWHGREADVIVEVPVRGEAVPLIVCVLIEHQTQSDRLVPLRTLFTAVGYWESVWRAWEQQEGRGDLTLPAVLPIVQHTGTRRWAAARTFAELVRGPEALRAFTPGWGPLLWSLMERTADELLAGGNWMHFLAVMRVTYENWPEFERVMRAACRRLNGASVPDHVRSVELLRAAIAFVLSRRPGIETEQLAQIIEEEGGPVEEVRFPGRTIANRAEWRMGRQMVRDLLEDRFGPLSEELTRRIEEVEDHELLRHLNRRAARIDSPDQLFEPPPAA